MVIQINESWSFFPKIFSTEYLVEIITSTETLDVTSSTMKAECSLVSTDNIGDFTLVLDNNHGLYNNKFNGGETVNIYIDYQDGSSLIFTGITEAPKSTYDMSLGSRLNIKGIHISGDLLNIHATVDLSGVLGHVAVQQLVSSYLSSLGYTAVLVSGGGFVNETTETMNKSFEDTPIINIFQYICGVCGFEFYADNLKQLHFFESNSIINEDEAIVEGDNLLSIDELGTVITDVKNNIKVVGAEIEGMPTFYTSTDSNSTLNTRQLRIDDENITDFSQAKDRADTEISIQKDGVVEGKAPCMGLPQLNPGELVVVRIKSQDILAYYRVAKITHRVGAEVDYLYTTEVFLDRQPKGIQHLLKEQLKKNTDSEKKVNPNGLNYAYVIPFDSINEGTVTPDNSLIVVDGALQLNSGFTTGTFESNAYTSPVEATIFELRANVSDEVVIGTSAFFSFSADNGTGDDVPTTVGLNGNVGSLNTVTSTGTQIRAKVTLTSDATHPNPKTSGIGVLFS